MTVTRKRLALVSMFALLAVQVVTATGLAESRVDAPSLGVDEAAAVPTVAVRFIGHTDAPAEYHALYRALVLRAGVGVRVERRDATGADRAEEAEVQIELLEAARAEEVSAVILAAADSAMLAPYADQLDGAAVWTVGPGVAGTRHIMPSGEAVAAQAVARAREVIDAAGRRATALLEVATVGNQPAVWLGDALGLRRGATVALAREPDTAAGRMRGLLAAQPEVVLVHAADIHATRAALAAVAALGESRAAHVIGEGWGAGVADAELGVRLAGFIVVDVVTIAARIVAAIGTDDARAEATGPVGDEVVWVDATNRDTVGIQRILAMYR